MTLYNVILKYKKPGSDTYARNHIASHNPTDIFYADININDKITINEDLYYIKGKEMASYSSEDCPAIDGILGFEHRFITDIKKNFLILFIVFFITAFGSAIFR